MEWIKTILSLTDQQKIFAVAAVSDVGGSAPRETGAKIIVLQMVSFFILLAEESLAQVIEQAKKCILDKKMVFSVIHWSKNRAMLRRSRRYLY